MVDSSHMVIAGMRLRQIAPEQWNDFVLGVREYAAQVTDSMKQATPENLAKVQGMAIMASEIAAILIEAPKTYEKIEQLRRGTPHGQRS